MNQLSYGNNLDILRAHIDAESLDLSLYGSTFNSKRAYYQIFSEDSGPDEEICFKN